MREAGELAHEGGLDLTHAPVGKPHARYAHLEDALVLEEVQMPVALDRGVVDGVFPGHFGMSKPTAGDKVHGNRQRPGLGIEGHIPYMPGCSNPQSRLKELRFRHHRHSSLGALAVSTP